MTTTLTHLPNTATTADTCTAYRLLRRFDVHQVERVSTELMRLGADQPVSVNGVDVEMIDGCALAALDELVDGHVDLRFVDSSVALRATMSYTGHHRLAARCTASPILVAA